MMEKDMSVSQVEKAVSQCKSDVAYREPADNIPLVDAPAKKGNEDSNTPGWAGQGKRG